MKKFILSLILVCAVALSAPANQHKERPDNVQKKHSNPVVLFIQHILGVK